MTKKVAIHNLGCKVNAYESDLIRSRFSGEGYEVVPYGEEADIVIINTCCVTATAEKKSRQMLHRARKANKNALIAAVGCYSQIGAEVLAADGTADIIVGSEGKEVLFDIIESGARGVIKDAAAYRERCSLSGLPFTRDHTRGFIKVEDGCDNFCSYCIIPYARGRVRSRQPSEIIREIGALAADGCRETVLSGINLSAFGRDLENENALAELIREVSKIEGISRIRLGSLEPVMITERFLDAVSGIKKLCPHFHLSLQSGCKKTLAAMNRRYTPEEYFDKCGLLRQYFDEPSVTTDIIAGFPGETEEDFEESYAFVKSVGFFETHVFPYSRREGTKAALMKEQVPGEAKKERTKRLLDLNANVHRTFLEKRTGETVSVLFEETESVSGRIYLSGHTPRYEKVLVPEGKAGINEIRDVRCTRVGADASGGLCLTGEAGLAYC